MRLIDADALSKVVNADINRCYQLGIGSVGPLSLFLDQINEQPTINPDDLRPHGWWKIKLDEYDCEYAMCSVCGEEFYDASGEDTIDITFNYCPNCGAKMDGE